MLNHFTKLRQDLYNFFLKRKDSLLNLIDSLAGNHNASSVVRLSLEPHYARSYSTISKAIDHVFDKKFQSPQKLTQLLQANLPSCQILVTDVTPIKRPFAATLKERCLIHQCYPLKCQIPVTIGHNYSFVCALAAEEKWVLPLSVKRIKPLEVRTLVGIDQLEEILENKPQQWIHVADTDYSGGDVLKRLANLSCTSLIRLRSNRVLYFPVNKSGKHIGRPKIYGKKFYFKHPSKNCEEILINHKLGYLKIERWKDLLIRETQVLIDVVRLRLYKNNRLVFKHPIWLAIVGQKEIDIRKIPHAYERRFDIEHFFRFGKRKFLLNSFPTPKVESEENWMWIAILSQWMLYFAKEQAVYHPFAWEKKDRNLANLTTPSIVQKDYTRLIKDLAQQACFPKRRGNSCGRLKGRKLSKRKRYPVIKKWKSKIDKAHPPPKTIKNPV